MMKGISMKINSSTSLLLLAVAALACGFVLVYQQAAFAGGSSDGWNVLFNGKDLTGWDGDPRLWSVKDGVIHGETTPEKPHAGQHIPGLSRRKFDDFELNLKFRIQNGNSGVQYRSKEFDKWRIGGYQAEVENNQGKVGFLYHEAGRASLVEVGDFMVIDARARRRSSAT